MAYRLINQEQPDQTLNITRDAWLDLLELAEEQGWLPIGPVLPHYGFTGVDAVFLKGRNGGNGSAGVVIWEDALNLADALEQAFLEYEPVFMPASYFYFEPENARQRSQPGIGTLLTLIDFCRLGAFWIEPYHPAGSLPPQDF